MTRAFALLGTGLVAATLSVTVPSPAGLHAQEPVRLAVQVQQVAGGDVYLNVGTRQGLAIGDTLLAARDSVRPPEGSVVVTAATETRSVVRFAGNPFPVTRGGTLILYLMHPLTAAEPGALGGPPRRVNDGGGAREAGPRPFGRVGLEMSASRSTTLVGEVDPASARRTFATPVLRLDATVPEAVGGFTLRTSLRAAHRYAGETVITPATSVRVYAAQAEREFDAVPLRVVFGRFSSPLEAFGGYWDGLLVRVGRRGLGVGAVVGFEPDRWNETPSTDVPKATAFLDVDRRGTAWRWRGSVSAHTIRPPDSLPTHTYLGAVQRLSVGRVVVSQDLQVDRDPTDGAWRLSRLRVRGSVGVGGPLTVRAGFQRLETYSLGFGGPQPFAPRSDRVDGGFFLRGRRGFLSGDVGVTENLQGDRTWGTTASFALYRVAGLGATGASGSVSRWTGPHGEILTASPSLSRTLGGGRLRIGYRFSHADYLNRVTTTHGADASFDVRLGQGLRLFSRVRAQWVGPLRHEGVDLRLVRIF